MTSCGGLPSAVATADGGLLWCLLPESAPPRWSAVGDVSQSRPRLWSAAGVGPEPTRRVGALLVSLGEEVAALLLQHLDAAELEQVAAVLGHVEQVAPELRQEVLAEFSRSLLANPAGPRGGVESARELLTAAVGADRAAAILRRTEPRPATGLERLRLVDPVEMASLISREHPQAIALILSQLDAAPAAGVLACLPAQLQGEVAHRVATLGRVDPDILQATLQHLAAMLDGTLAAGRSAGGAAVVARILDQAGPRMEKELLQRLETRDPEVAESIRRRLLVFDDLLELDDRSTQHLLQQVPLGDLVLALRTAGKGLRDHLLSNMSEGRRQVVFDELANSGPVRRREVEEAQMRLVAVVRQLDEQGVIHLPRRGAADPYV